MSLTDVLLAKGIIGGGSGTGEDTTNKVSSITDENKSSTTYYPSVKAVVDYNPIVFINGLAEYSDFSDLNTIHIYVESNQIGFGGWAEIRSLINAGKMVYFRCPNVNGDTDNTDVAFVQITSCRVEVASGGVTQTFISGRFTHNDDNNKNARLKKLDVSLYGRGCDSHPVYMQADISY